MRGAQKGWGLNVETGEVEDLLKSGIGDPTMVTRSALQNAASIAKNILTTEAIVAEAPEKAGAAMGGGMPDMGGMMYGPRERFAFARFQAKGRLSAALRVCAPQIQSEAVETARWRRSETLR